MLRQLEIENIAVIEKASVSLHEGFHVFTGETGAGKSILIDAINAVLGGRIRKDLVRTGAAKATVQALFDELDPQVVQSAAQLGYPCDPGENSLLFMREFSPDGKSSCRINGRLATAAILRQLAGKLIDIHGQHDNQAPIDTAEMCIRDRSPVTSSTMSTPKRLAHWNKKVKVKSSSPASWRR